MAHFVENNLSQIKIAETHCFHCNGLLPKSPIEKDNHLFCCKGCVSVYAIIKESGLENIYANKSLGSFSKPADNYQANEFDFLEIPSVQEKIISFKEGNICKVVLYAPDIHCASCIWLLEHLPKLHSGVIQSQVNFHSKKISVLFDVSKLSLKNLAILLTQIGYKPHFSFEKKSIDVESRKLLMRLGVAGFAFGNIMLLSFPDYLDTLHTLETQYKTLFHYVSLMLSLPVVFFSAYPYLRAFADALKSKELNMDVPIGIGILTLFFRSMYDVLVLNESGYFDSLSGFIFFLLIGRWYQHKTYQFLDFDKSLNSFFPISVIKIENLNEVVKEVKDIAENDLVLLRNGELIPFECVLMSEEANIDYAFVTGESDVFRKQKGDLIYAGGKLYGQRVLVRVKKPFDQKYFVQLWNENMQRKNYAFKKISVFLGKLITILVLMVAAFAVYYWRDSSMDKIFKVLTSVLIIGCSCAFALSAPFLFGNVSRVLSRLSFFVKNADSIATLAQIHHIVLDKTGTITEKKFEAKWNGRTLAKQEINLLYTLFQNSFHPLSRKITDALKDEADEKYDCEYFKEYAGKGLEAVINGCKVKAGSKEWIGQEGTNDAKSSSVFVQIGDEVVGYFSVQSEMREGLQNLVQLTEIGYQLHVLTGDSNTASIEPIKNLFQNKVQILTHQSPENKKAYIENLQRNGDMVMMIGDGLNDMPALKTADFGISITDDNSYFAPSGDAILKGDNLRYIPNILKYSKISYRLLMASYAFSFLYNAVGLSLAFSGLLSPLVAAVFMPLSSISVVLFAVLSTNYYARKYLILTR
ncbi:MAG: heavy metal translocating P-type ATPase metal-binding domain-containing protein [Bacteroidia bacterium]